MMRLILVGGLAATVGGCFGYFPGRLAYWESQLDEMCAKDGGRQTFELIYLPAETYYRLLNSRGELHLPHETAGDKSAPVYYRKPYQTIRERDPSVSRDELQIIRRVDGKLLGTKVTYSLTGGEFNPPTIGHRSRHHRWCPPYEFDHVFYAEVIKKVP